MTRESMVFYKSFYEAIKTLPDEERLRAYDYIMGYGLDGEEPEGKTVAFGIFLMARPQIDANNRRYENGKKGGRQKTEIEPENIQAETEKEPKLNQTETKVKPNNNQTITKVKPNVNVNVNENENIKEILPKGSTKKSAECFTPPSKDELENYCRENGYSIDVDRFIDFYSSKGWMVGKNKMKDWKAACRNWDRSQRQELTAEGTKRQGKSAAPNRFHNFREHDYDYDALMKQAIMKNRGE